MEIITQEVFVRLALEDVADAFEFSVGGEAAPLDPSKWTFSLNTSKTTVDVDMPAGVPANSVVWFSAMWFNQRKQTSPPATAQSTVIGGGMALAA